MAQKKLQRFGAIKAFTNVIEHPASIKGQWHQYFKNSNPIVLELACGRGEYTVGLASMHKNINVIGVDIKGNRMYIGAKKCLDQQLTNAAFLRTQIENITEHFTEGEVHEIWITFPDPQLRTSKAKKRLTHPRFLRLYKNILQQNGVIHLKTDSPQLYKFTQTVAAMCNINVLTQSNNVYAQAPVAPELLIKTHYEALDIAQSKQIHYISFNLPTSIGNVDEALQQVLKNEEEDRGGN
jgi:tRNA (guanine-N7-)-methyltransferase